MSLHGTLQFSLITKLPLTAPSTSVLPAPRPPATPYAGAGHLGGQVPSPRPRPPRAPLVLPQTTFPGATRARHAPPPFLRSPRRLPWPAELPRPCAPPPAPSSPANSPPARPPPPPLPIKGTARPFAREPARRPAISAATQAPPWSHRLATPLSNPSKPRPASPHTGPLQRILKCPEPPDSPRSAAAAQYRRRDPPNDEPPSPAFLHTNQPPERKLLGLLKLSDPSATSFPHRNMNAGDQTRRRPPLSVEPPLRTTSARPKTTGR